jgi:uncharacterized protein (DUF924 family)
MDLIRDWWLQNSNVWFDSNESDDIEITTKFETMFELVYDEVHLIENIFDGIGYIILHDQIARHVKRAKQYPEQFVSDKLDKILGFVEKFYLHNALGLSGYDFYFVLLPLRHTNIFSSQLFVINETWKKINEFDPNTSNLHEQKLIHIYKNYLKASYERACIEKTPIILSNLYGIGLGHENKMEIDVHNQIEEFIVKFADILDTSCHNYKSNLTNIPTDKTDKTDKIDKTNKIIKECLRLKNKFPPNIILSISGGVDSMVLSWILSILNRLCLNSYQLCK